MASITSGRLVGQKDHAVRPRAVGERELELVAALGQAVLDDRFHARLTEGAAHLLVGEHVAQRGDLLRQVGDVLLRAVDDREPLVQLLQALDRLLGGVRHRLADPARHGVEPLVDEPRELGLPRRQHFAHGLHPAGGLGLDPRHLGDAGLKLLGAHRLPVGIARARDRAAAHHHDRPARAAP